MKKFLLLILLLSGIKYVHAQSAHLKFDHFRVTDGLPERRIQFIKEDNPFFTTKPTGEGTGLGLFLTYDIVVKGHGGKIELNTKEGEFSEFAVYLPT